MSGPSMSEADIQQMVLMCRAMFSSPNEQERTQAKQALNGFSIAALNLQPFLSILPRSTDPYFLQFVTQSLRRIVTRHWKQLDHPKDALQICQVSIAFLRKHGPSVPHFIISSFSHLIARVVKLAWNTNNDIRLINTQIADFTKLSLQHAMIAFNLWREMVDEMSSTTSNDIAVRITDLTYSDARKACINFSTYALLLISQASVDPLFLLYRGQAVQHYTQLNQEYCAQSNSSPASFSVTETSVSALIQSALSTFVKCLQYDFMGLNQELHLEDTSVIVIGNARQWRTILEHCDLFNTLCYISRCYAGLSTTNFGFKHDRPESPHIGSVGGDPSLVLQPSEDGLVAVLQLLACLVSIRCNAYSSTALKMRLYRNVCLLTMEMAAHLISVDPDMDEPRFQTQPGVFLQFSILLFKLKCNLVELDLVNLWHPAFETGYSIQIHPNAMQYPAFAQVSGFISLHDRHLKDCASSIDLINYIRDACGSAHTDVTGNTSSTAQLVQMVVETNMHSQPFLTHLFLSLMYLLTISALKSKDPGIYESPAIGYLLHTWAKLSTSPPHFPVSITQHSNLDSLLEVTENEDYRAQIRYGLAKIEPNLAALIHGGVTGPNAEDREQTVRSALQSRDISSLFILDLLLPRILHEFIITRVQFIVETLSEATKVNIPINLARLTDSKAAAAAQQGFTPHQTQSGNQAAIQQLFQYDFGGVDTLLNDHSLHEQLSSATAIAKFSGVISVDLFDSITKVFICHYLTLLRNTHLLAGASFMQPTTVHLSTMELAAVGVDTKLHALTYSTGVPRDAVKLELQSCLTQPACQELVVYLASVESVLSFLLSVIAPFLYPEVLPATRKTPTNSSNGQEDIQVIESVCCYLSWMISSMNILRSGCLENTQNIVDTLFSSHISILTSSIPTSALFATQSLEIKQNSGLSLYSIVNSLIATSLVPNVLPGPPRSTHLDKAILQFLRAFQQRFCGLAAMRVYRNNELEGFVLRASSLALGHTVDSRALVELMVCLIIYTTAYWSIRIDGKSITQLNDALNRIHKTNQPSVLFSPSYGFLPMGSGPTDPHSAPAKTLQDWLQQFMDLLTGYTTGQSLSSMQAVQWLLGLSSAHMLLRTTLYGQRKIMTECLSRIVLRPSSDSPVHKELLYPLDIKYGTIQKQLVNSQFAPTLRQLILGVLADTTGIISACDSKVQYSTIFHWFVPRYLSLAVRICQACWSDNAIVEAVITLVAELIDGRNGRASIEPSNLSAFVLVKELASLSSAYTLRVHSIVSPSAQTLRVEEDSDNEDSTESGFILDVFSGQTVSFSMKELYESKLRCSTLLFSAMSKLIKGYHSKLQSFEFHKDKTLLVCIDNILRLIQTIDIPDVLNSNEMATAVFVFLETLTRFVPELLLRCDAALFTAIIVLIEEGIDRFLSFSLGHALSSVANAVGETVINIISLLIGLSEQTKFTPRDVLFHAAPNAPSDIDVLIASQALSVFVDFHLRVLPGTPSNYQQVDETALPYGSLVSLDKITPLSETSIKAAELLPKMRAYLAQPKCAVSLQNIFVRVAHHYVFETDELHGFASRVLFPMIHAFPSVWAAYNQLLCQNLSSNALNALKISPENATEKIAAEARMVSHAAAACFDAAEKEADTLQCKPSWEVLLGNGSSSGLNGCNVLKSYRNYVISVVSKPSM